MSALTLAGRTLVILLAVGTSPLLADGRPNVVFILADDFGQRDLGCYGSTFYETAKFIENNKERPFFAYLSFYSVHTPLMARDDLRKKYEEKRRRLGLIEKWGREHTRDVRLVQEHAVYAAMIEAMDLAVGKVLAKLDALGLADNTLVIFTSDNGGLSTSEGWPTSNLPLRGGKGWLYEGGIREPLLVRWPTVVKPNDVIRTTVSSPDFFPTLLEVTDAAPEPGQVLDGVSLLPLFKGGQLPERHLYWHIRTTEIRAARREPQSDGATGSSSSGSKTGASSCSTSRETSANRTIWPGPRLTAQTRYVTNCMPGRSRSAPFSRRRMRVTIRRSPAGDLPPVRRPTRRKKGRPRIEAPRGANLGRADHVGSPRKRATVPLSSCGRRKRQPRGMAAGLDGGGNRLTRSLIWLAFLIVAFQDHR